MFRTQQQWKQIALIFKQLKPSQGKELGNTYFCYQNAEGHNFLYIRTGEKPVGEGTFAQVWRTHCYLDEGAFPGHRCIVKIPEPSEAQIQKRLEEDPIDTLGYSAPPEGIRHNSCPMVVQCGQATSLITHPRYAIVRAQLVEEVRRQLQSEIAILRKVSHIAGIIEAPLLSFYQDGLPTACIYPEYRGNLRQFQPELLPPNNRRTAVQRLYNTLISALLELHRIAHHGDVKPRNVLYRTDANGTEFRLADFGGASLWEDFASSTKVLGTHTKPWVTSQSKKDLLDAETDERHKQILMRIDLQGAAGTCYWMATSEHPWKLTEEGYADDTSCGCKSTEQTSKQESLSIQKCWQWHLTTKLQVPPGTYIVQNILALLQTQPDNPASPPLTRTYTSSSLESSSDFSSEERGVGCYGQGRCTIA